jgi:Mitochondrial small ribosomal subunit Rsm22
VRVARSRLHRRAKAAELSWEDEKFSYLGVSRRRSPAAASSGVREKGAARSR